MCCFDHYYSLCYDPIHESHPPPDVSAILGLGVWQFLGCDRWRCQIQSQWKSILWVIVNKVDFMGNMVSYGGLNDDHASLIFQPICKIE